MPRVPRRRCRDLKPSSPWCSRGFFRCWLTITKICTAPSVRYRITTITGGVVEVDSPTKFPPPNEMAKIEEPVITAMIITAEDSVGAILQLCEEKRGVQKNFEYLSPQRVMLTYELPLNEIVLDFYDRLKSASRGYASLDYHLAG